MLKPQIEPNLLGIGTVMSHDIPYQWTFDYWPFVEGLLTSGLPSGRTCDTENVWLSWYFHDNSLIMAFFFQVLNLNILWCAGTIGTHITGSKLTQVMTWCLMAPRHYLKQCCFVIRAVQWQFHKCLWTSSISCVGTYLPGANEFIHFCTLYYTLLLTYWEWVMHICISKLTIIASDNGLLPGRRQAIIWTNAWILLIRP